MAEDNRNQNEKPQQSALDRMVSSVLRAQDYLRVWWDKLQHLERTNMEVGIQHLKLGNYFDSAARFRFVILLNRNNAIAHYLLGKSLMFQQKFAKAVGPLKKALQLKPDMEEASFLLAVCGHPSDVNAIPRSFIAEKADTIARPDVYESFLEQMSDPLHAILREELDKYYGERIGFNVIDISTRGGQSALLIRHRANAVIGVEPSLAMAGKARNLRENNLLVYNTLSTKFPEDYFAESKEKFDLALCMFYLDNYGDLEKFFTMVRNALNNGGLFAFNIKNTSGRDWGFIPGTVVFGHSGEYIRKLADRLGFKIVSQRDIIYPDTAGQGETLYLLEKKTA